MILWYLNHKPGGLVWAIFFTVRNTNLAKTNDKVYLNGPLRMGAYSSGENKWAFQQQFSDGVILSLGISETEIFYDYYDGKNWTRKWTR